MILYRLRCEGEHEFEGWFPDSTSFERQAELGLLSCPQCGGAKVTRALMAPAIRRTGRDATPVAAPAMAATPHGDDGSLPDAAMALLQKIRGVIEEHCVNAGERFAQEALKMHRGETQPAGIYGTMTEDEREMLDDEGVEVLAIPWVRPADS
ncbi:DUF1178 family protein [Novacetimonas pomaceti]|uniref:DUF1178 domain-containing protein n=1 Tax=Novacetimonas pomaceti TaxID=2021998 RepID=A0A318Q815_9PROT|nr:DUF1178 family protein [Novacetimonas pomaceti]MBV1832471.1 DUF1178 family protein [Novacetimonas pomaceti]PYD47969.1 DUF1178 domain-containing protein [Novacetimonas pomaceti]PYD75796.1 hypothetical protein CFR71_06925 [Novacetimonas pomaceti]